MEEDRDLIIIDNKEKLNSLVCSIKNREVVCDKFRFTPHELRDSLLCELNIDIHEFEKKYFIYDSEKKIHISESERGYVLISTIGLVAFNPTFQTDTEKIVYACDSQYEVMMILFEKLEKLTKQEDLYDINGYNYGYLLKLTIGLIHNIVFYLEVFSKSYISLNGEKFQITHSLKNLIKDVKKVMFLSKQNDSLFHVQIFLEFQKIVDVFSSSQLDFKEQYIKYNDCNQPVLLINAIKPLKDFIELSHDFIIQLYYDRNDCHYLKQGLLDRLIRLSETDDEKERIKSFYECLINQEI